jgi:tetratricopeptide (TPR) repeat protein
MAVLSTSLAAVAAGCGGRTSEASETTPGASSEVAPAADKTAAASEKVVPASHAGDVAKAAAPDAAPTPAPAVPALKEATATPHPVNLKIMSATLRKTPIADARVVLQKEGFVPLEGKTGPDGRVSLESRFDADDESVTLVVEKEGHSPFFVACPCDGLSYALSQTLGQDNPEAIRVVLNWVGQPQYLDLHLVYPNNYVSWNYGQKGADASLDVRADEAGGPATVTIQKRHPGEQYVLAAHRYSAMSHGDTVLRESRAKVFVYIGNSLIKTYHVSPKKAGSLWVVFAIDGKGAFHDIDNVVDIPEVENIGPYLRQVSERTSFATPTRPSKKAIAEAETWRKKAQTALAEGRAESAVLALQRAIQIHRAWPEAYTDLGAIYEKLGAAAEAQWARRLAAELSSRPVENGLRIPDDLITVKASSNLPVWKHYTFTPDNLLDDNLWSSWQPLRKPAGGVGEWVQLDFAQPLELRGFEISNGFRLIDELGDLYLMNNRVKDAVVELSDGTTQEFHFEDTSAQTTLLLSAPKTVSWAKFKVKSVYKGSRWNDLAISELHALGVVD